MTNRFTSNATRARNHVFACLAAAGCLGLSALFLLPGSSRAQAPTATPTPAAAKASGDEAISFNRDIRPILSDKCFACHGPDAAVAKDAGGFRLDLFDEATKPATSGDTPIVPGDSEASAIITRLTHTNPNLVMPPPKAKITVTPEEVELLRRWINTGAAYEGHWAYQTPTKPVLPEINGANEKWAKNSIDRFIAFRLEQAGLSPSPEADKPTLIRRVSLDMTGLPPTPEAIDAFVADESPNAYEKLVDRLLASPHFGERMALVWLDAARYGDTNGYHHDNIRTAWPWRQWVIQAFNDNMPYDQFVTEQLAGDLLPNATREQILASGFCRMHNINDEGGALNDEYLVETVADRIETIGTVMMAQTYTCARCHDHKYDPISQEDYFATWAYFNSVDQERGVYRNNFPAARAYPPFMLHQSDEDRLQQASLEKQIKQRRTELTVPEGLQTVLNKEGAVDWASLELVKAEAKNATLTIQEDGSVLASGKNPPKDTFTLRFKTLAQGLQVIRLDALRDASLPNGGLGRAKNANAVLTHIQAKAISTADPKLSRDLLLAYAHADHEQSNGDYDIQNAIRPDALGWAVDGHQKKGNRRVTLLAAEPFGYAGGTELVVTLHFKSKHAQHTLGRVKVDAAAPSKDPHFNEILDHLAKAKEIDKLTDDLQVIKNRATPVLIMKEAAKPVPAYILERGAYDKPIKDNPIQRKPPSMINLAMPEGAPDNRLGFAQWLTQPEHPLTSRVQVNRLWQLLFGTGIVKTVEDFGSQAAWPSHPALLDYLAVHFVESGWDQKSLIREIVTSATYRQRATRVKASKEYDADNRMLSYFPRQRLKAEFIRDQALFVAGLLNDQIGGPSVKPYQPGDLWNEVAITGTNTGQFKRDTGEALYRRSMYTFWKKTSPPAQMQIFNAPTREFCTVDRDTTNTPLQVLTLWNDEQFLEASRVLAQRTLADAAEDPKRLELIYRRCTGDLPNAKELAVLQDVLAYYRERYSDSVEDARTLLTQGDYPLPETHDPAELASWMMVASTALSLDQTIVRD